MKTATQIYNQRNRVFQKAMTHAQQRASEAHPATGGVELFVRNWGNDAARAAWRRAWERWRRFDAAASQRYERAYRDELRARMGGGENAPTR